MSYPIYEPNISIDIYGNAIHNGVRTTTLKFQSLQEFKDVEELLKCPEVIQFLKKTKVDSIVLDYIEPKRKDIDNRDLLDEQFNSSEPLEP